MTRTVEVFFGRRICLVFIGLSRRRCVKHEARAQMYNAGWMNFLQEAFDRNCAVSVCYRQLPKCVCSYRKDTGVLKKTCVCKVIAINPALMKTSLY